MVCLLRLLLWVFCLQLVRTTFFSVFNGIGPALETPDYNKYETLRGLTTLSQEWMKFHKLFEVDQIRFYSSCRHLFCDPHLVAHQPPDPQTLAVAWTNNAAHNWSENEVSGWLKTHIGLAGFEPLIHVNQITGDVLPSLLLREQRHAFEVPIPVDLLDVLERGITELILLGPPSRLSLQLPVTVMSVSVVVILCVCWMVTHCYLSSRRARQKRLSWLDLQRTRLTELHDRMCSLDSEIPDFALGATPTKTSKRSKNHSGDRLSGSVSQANSDAFTVMQQILDVTVRHERSYFEHLLESTGTLLLEIENQLYDHRYWVPFAVDLTDLNSLMESFDSSLLFLDGCLSEFVKRCYFMQETMDILRTLNECQAKVDLSYQEERGICPNETDELVFVDRDQIMFTPRRSPVLAEDEVNEREQSSVCPSPDSSLSCNASGNLEMSPHVNETEVTEFCDENEPRHCSQSSDVSTHEPKIPKPSRIPCHTLTPSFHLMNPPASIQRNQLSLATPSHIPLGPLKFLNGHPAKSQPSMETTKRLSDLVGRVPSDEL